MRCFDFEPEGAKDCTVSAYLLSADNSPSSKTQPLPAIVICPGGGYAWVSPRESEPVAREYLSAGYHVFILKYSVNEDISGFLPLCQLASVMVHIRKFSAEWSIDPEKIAVCGFSAGAHLAASLGTLFNEEKFLRVWNKGGNIRPNAMILGYPVILSNEYAHTASIERVSGAAAGSDEFAWFGLDQHVDSLTPPTFLWHTAADSLVPAENSLLFALALSSAQIPYELHIFPDGEHGMSVCTQEVGCPDEYNGRWIAWSILWLNKLFQYTK